MNNVQIGCNRDIIFVCFTRYMISIQLSINVSKKLIQFYGTDLLQAVAIIFMFYATYITSKKLIYHRNT